MDASYNSLKTAKQEVRKQMKAQRRRLSSSYRAEADKRILANLEAEEVYQKCRTLFSYVSFGEEPETRTLILHALRAGKKVSVPHCQNDGRMEAFEITGLQDLKEGFHGILEPGSHCVRREPDYFDLCVIPCVACMREGVRLGYGGGYYDRYLPKTRGFRVLLCHEKQVCQDLPTERHDCLMDMIITENQVIFC